ncbi:hypothetical protein K443DRAFT_334089 [Laccaria amethystina LaAM-08-1]|uniref:Uncharacterized protein n=1 Tax=Laccaria amethystina LaAM-08-1 TaxID=1095629 RepID=A0A0C9X0M5_9AGAR|nr:hypothetical protein K443DRAFT_334089 [Laccaria amethystina LaAM-08-1]
MDEKNKRMTNGGVGCMRRCLLRTFSSERWKSKYHTYRYVPASTGGRMTFPPGSRLPHRLLHCSYTRSLLLPRRSELKHSSNEASHGNLYSVFPQHSCSLQAHSICYYYTDALS